MDKELDEALVADFPNLYRDRHADMRQTAMCWGFPGNGWEPLIRQLSEKLEPLVEGTEARAVQVKEKFGGLCFYMSAMPSEIYDEVQDWIVLAESRSYWTCEVCGDLGVRRKGGWIKVLCDEHSEGRPPAQGLPSLVSDPNLWDDVISILWQDRNAKRSQQHLRERLDDFVAEVQDLIYEEDQPKRWGGALLDDFREWKS